MQYYNGALASWEPLIEPVEVLRDKKYISVPWELNCNVSIPNFFTHIFFFKLLTPNYD